MNRATTPSEIDEEKVRNLLPTLPTRNRLLVELGFETGLRLGELLGLTVGDVWRDGQPVAVLRLQRSRLKGGRSQRNRSVVSRIIPLNVRARAAIVDHLETVGPGFRLPDLPLFLARGRVPRAITPRQAQLLIRDIFLRAGLSPDGVWSPHSLRRRFVRRLMDRTHDIDLVREAVGHRWVTTTQIYLGKNEEAAGAAILQLGEPQAPQAEMPVRIYA